MSQMEHPTQSQQSTYWETTYDYTARSRANAGISYQVPTGVHDADAPLRPPRQAAQAYDRIIGLCDQAGQPVRKDAA
jgi:hypothetical protein